MISVLKYVVSVLGPMFAFLDCVDFTGSFTVFPLCVRTDASEATTGLRFVSLACVDISFLGVEVVCVMIPCVVVEDEFTNWVHAFLFTMFTMRSLGFIS